LTGFFSRLPDEAEKTQFRFSGKKGQGINNEYFFLVLQFFGAMSERLPSKRDDAFCLSSGKAKISCLSCNPV
jgi:hypothetical protein